jgi:RHS repeat-associated protein
VDLTYLISGSNRGRDSYTGLDRFGRVVDQRWLRSGDGTAVERLQYTYDRNGSRLSRVNLLNSELSESYSYDNLNQLISFTRGEHSRSWDYDAQGNWQSVVTDGNVHTRTHNAQNEITGISGAVIPTYDANGNLTRDEAGRQFVYDAWNRLVEVRDGSGETVKRYAYDGLHRRISETAGGVTTDFYYSDQWQVLEERVGGQTTVQYVWSPVYVDALILRDRDTNGDGTLEERLWVVQDANFNVTALLDDSGEVVERYVYDPFGQATVLDAEWNVRSGGSAYDWLYLHQGGRFDATSGLYHFRFRDYSPTLGRWTSLDPLSYAAGDVNLYRTVGNGPTVYTDPNGLSWISDAWDWIVDAGGVVLTVPREVIRWPAHAGVELFRGKWPFAAELLEHSLQDNPTDKFYPDGSMPSNKIKASSEHTKTVLPKVTKEICAAPAGSVSGKGTTKFVSDTDLLAALHEVEYHYYGQKKEDGSWMVTIYYKDTYNFESMTLRGQAYNFYSQQGYGGKCKGLFFFTVNELTVIEQFLTSIRPFKVTIAVKESGWCTE